MPLDQYIPSANEPQLLPQTNDIASGLGVINLDPSNILNLKNNIAVGTNHNISGFNNFVMGDSILTTTNNSMLIGASISVNTQANNIMVFGSNISVDSSVDSGFVIGNNISVTQSGNFNIQLPSFFGTTASFNSTTIFNNEIIVNGFTFGGTFSNIFPNGIVVNGTSSFGLNPTNPVDVEFFGTQEFNGAGMAVYSSEFILGPGNIYLYNNTQTFNSFPGLTQNILFANSVGNVTYNTPVIMNVGVTISGTSSFNGTTILNGLGITKTLHSFYTPVTNASVSDFFTLSSNTLTNNGDSFELTYFGSVLMNPSTMSVSAFAFIINSPSPRDNTSRYKAISDSTPRLQYWEYKAVITRQNNATAIIYSKLNMSTPTTYTASMGNVATATNYYIPPTYIESGFGPTYGLTFSINNVLEFNIGSELSAVATYSIYSGKVIYIPA